MEVQSDGDNRQSLMPRTEFASARGQPRDPEETAQYTHQLLVAAQLSFAFAHGVLLVSICVGVSRQSEPRWAELFLPAWIGNGLCSVLIIASWFGSCPYIKLCLKERQARLGDANPSILTDILPEIVMSILGLFFVALSFTGEFMLCRCLSGSCSSFLPCGTVFIIVAVLASCWGICVRSTELFNFLGVAFFVTFVLAVSVPGGLAGSSAWLLTLPLLLSGAGLLANAMRKLHLSTRIFSREERLLRMIEQGVLGAILLALLGLGVALKLEGGLHVEEADEGTLWSLVAGGAAGVGVCVISLLRARMAIVEKRDRPVRERMVLLKAQQTLGHDPTEIGPFASALHVMEDARTINHGPLLAH